MFFTKSKLFQTASVATSLEVSKRPHPKYVCVSLCMCVCLSVFYLLLDHWKDRNETVRDRRHQPLDGYYILKNTYCYYLSYLWKTCISLNSGRTYPYLSGTGDLPPTSYLSFYLLPTSYLPFYLISPFLSHTLISTSYLFFYLLSPTSFSTSYLLPPIYLLPPFLPPISLCKKQNGKWKNLH